MNTRAPALLPNFADLLLDAIFLVDINGCIVHVSAACERIFGYQPYEMIGRSMIDFVAPEDRVRTLDEAGKVIAGQERIGFENRYMRKDGSRVTIMWSARWLEAGQLRIGVARDVTARKRSEERQAALYTVSEAAHGAHDLPALFAEIHRIVAGLLPVAAFAIASCAADRKQIVFPYQSGQSGQSDLFDKFNHSDTQTTSAFAQDPAVVRQCEAVIRSRKPLLLPEDAPDSELTRSQADVSWLLTPLVKHGKSIGVLVLKSLPGTAYSLDDKELLSFVAAQVATAMERAQLHADLLHAARYDDLTGLPNRRLFHDRMKSALARCRRRQSRLAVLYVDIDDFKTVNDTHGHAGGDLLLQEFARRLEHGIREADTVARLGGDEFVALIEDVQKREDALAVAEKIRCTIEEPIVIDGCTLHVRASMGIALYPDDAGDEDALLGSADHAMYLDKGSKRRAGAA
jgi:diguanylate cyclase (GGDEF)-like protein/PAS domain S-box-containing protein